MIKNSCIPIERSGHFFKTSKKHTTCTRTRSLPNKKQVEVGPIINFFNWNTCGAHPRNTTSVKHYTSTPVRAVFFNLKTKTFFRSSIVVNEIHSLKSVLFEQVNKFALSTLFKPHFKGEKNTFLNSVWWRIYS